MSITEKDRQLYAKRLNAYINERIIRTALANGKEPDVDRLILALLQAKGILRRAKAEMTNTTHEGEL